MLPRSLSPWFWLVAAAFLTSCASTTLLNQWRADDYRGGPFRKILVIGISDQEGLRRTFEDVFVARLRSRGVDAIAGYRLLPSTRKADEQSLLEAVRGSGAQGVIMTRVVGVDIQTRYSPGYWWPGPGFYGYYTWAWAYYEPPQVEQYKVFTLETNLWEMRSKSLIWSGTTRTMQSGEIYRKMEALAGVIIGALERSGLIASTGPKKGN